MKKIMITTALVASLISLGYSQEIADRPRKESTRTEMQGDHRQARTPEQRAQMATDILEKKLSLTPEQKARVYGINLERAEKMDKTIKSEREFHETHIKTRKSLMEESEKELIKILNIDQQKSYDDMKKNSQERMKARHHRGPGTRIK